MWLTGWQYRKKINLTGSVGAGTNYQVLLKVGESSGASGYDFHVNGHSANFPSGKNQGGDLRFTANDGITLLDFWVESVAGTSPNRVANIWVEVSADLGTNQSIYCYYGNPNATNVSNGDNTFLFFDDFEGSSLDTTKWDSGITVLSYGNSIINFQSSINNHRYLIYKLATYSDVKLVARQYDTSIYPVIGLVSRKSSSSGSVIDSLYYNRIYNFNATDSYHEIRKRVSGAESAVVQNTLTNFKANSWIHQELLAYGSNLKSYFYRESDGFSHTVSATDTSHTSGYVGLFAEWTGKNIYCDWFFVAKYVSPEPAFSSAGNEEIFSGIVARRGLIMSM
jgi:hypothetical protein